VLSIVIDAFYVTAVSDALVVPIANCHIAPEWSTAVRFRIGDGESAGEPVVIHGPAPIPVFLGGIGERLRREEQEERQC